MSVIKVSQEEAWKIRAEDIIFSFEGGFYVERVSDDTHLIIDDINGKYLKVIDPDFERKFWNAYTEIFTKAERELKLKDKYEIFPNIDGINIFYPNFTAIDIVEDKKYKYTESGIKYRRKGKFLEAVIPYNLFIEWLYELLEL